MCGCTSKTSESTSKDNLNSENECIQPYMFEPNREDEPQGLSDDLSENSTSSDNESFDEKFEAENAWYQSSLQWCKCEKCSIVNKKFKSFSCHEEALEYDDLLTGAKIKDWSA